MAKLSAHGAKEVARIRDSEGNERAYLSTGKILSKVKGGRWVEVVSFAAARGDARSALFAKNISALIERGWFYVTLNCSISTIMNSPAYSAMLLKGQQAVARAAELRARKEAEQRMRAAAERPQREREEKEREQHAEAALELRMAAGRAITCSGCGNILDASTTVLFRYATADATLFAFCGACWDRFYSREAAAELVRDGREIPAHVWKHTDHALVAAKVQQLAGGA